MNAQERADFYYEILTSDISEKVFEAENARQEVNDDSVRIIVDNCASFKRQIMLEKKLIEREEKGIDIKTHRQNIDLGFAGFFRIDTVHNRSMAKRSDEQNKIKYINNAYEAHRGHAIVERTTKYIHKTIHGSPIIWKAETDQDIAGVMVLEGNDEEALNVIDNSIDEILELLNNTSSKELIPVIQSSLGVLYYRRSKASQKIKDLDWGLKYINEANKKMPNWHRTATVAWYLLKGSITFENQPISMRIKGIKNAFMSLSKAFLTDPKSTLISIKQSVQGG